MRFTVPEKDEDEDEEGWAACRGELGSVLHVPARREFLPSVLVKSRMGRNLCGGSG